MAGVSELAALEQRLAHLVAGFDGVAGVVVEDLACTARIAINADEVFPAASSIKIQLLAAALELHAAGEIDLDQVLVVAPEAKVSGSGVLCYLQDHVELSIRDLLTLMIIVSDNTATNMIIDLVSLERAGWFLDRWGLDGTRIARKMQDREAYAADRDNLSTPRDMVRMLRLLYEGEQLAAGVGAECLRILEKPKRGYLAAAVPPGTRVASKPGGMEFVRCDAGLIGLKRRPYAIAIMTKFCALEPHAQERWVSAVARTVYRTMAVVDAANAHGQGIADYNRA